MTVTIVTTIFNCPPFSHSPRQHPQKTCDLQIRLCSKAPTHSFSVILMSLDEQMLVKDYVNSE